MKFTQREEMILNLLKDTKLSPSHDIDHSLNTAFYAGFLSKKYKGERDIVVAACLLHDLGRMHRNIKGKENAMKGAEMAKTFLIKTGYSKDEIRKISIAISEHDQPELHSDNINSRILKDADFIDGFGARGILRVGMHTGETGGDISDALERLNKKLKKRINGLEFLESKRLGWKLSKFMELFLEELKPIQNLSKEFYSGKLIIIEGISGSGKDTQVKLLTEYLNNKKIKTKIVKYPTEEMRNLWRQWKKTSNNPKSELHLMLADMANKNEETLDALRKGEMVMCLRSSISTQVYQYSDPYDQFFTKYSFRFDQAPDVIIYLDINPKIAWQRVKRRSKIKGGKSFFSHIQTKQHLLYNKILSQYPNVVRIDANQSMENVHNEIIYKLKTYL